MRLFKKFLLLNVLCLAINLYLFAQHHEIGVSGGYLYGAPDGETSTANGGFDVGAYYLYAPCRFVGIQTGAIYKNNKLYYMNDYHTVKSFLQLPVNLILFPRFKFSLIGGIYMQCLLDKIIGWSGKQYGDDDKLHESFCSLDRRPSWGYNLGIKWNMKYLNVGLAYKKDMTSWLGNLEEAQNWNAFRSSPKAFSIHAFVEILLWRDKKKNRLVK